MTGTTSPAVEENSIDKSENPEQYNEELPKTNVGGNDNSSNQIKYSEEAKGENVEEQAKEEHEETGSEFKETKDACNVTSNESLGVQTKKIIEEGEGEKSAVIEGVNSDETEKDERSEEVEDAVNAASKDRHSGKKDEIPGKDKEASAEERRVNEALIDGDEPFSDEEGEKNSISGNSLIMSKQRDLEEELETFEQPPNSPPLPPRAHIAGQAPQLPERSENEEPLPPLPPRSHIAESLTGAVHSVPPPFSEELKSDKFREHLKKHKRSDSSDFDLILNRFVQNETELDLRNDKDKENAKQGNQHLKEEFDNIQDSTQKELVQYDWPFWSKLVHNYAEMVKTESKKLETEVGKGIPPQIRGIIWQLMTNSNSQEMEELYNSLLLLDSVNEKAIRRDLSRTKFITEDKTNSLFNVLKAYSLYDPAVGYTQGMGFIATTLILNCDEEWQSFSLFIKLMKVYGFRELFLPGMPGLMLKLYQFDTLLEEHDPQLYNHLIRQGIRSSMFATQWFLTMFAYKFPLDFVLRIMDIIILEGIESLLKFSLNLLIKNSRNLIILNFDSLLEFLKEDLFQKYATGESEEEYDIDTFINDSLEIKITPLQIERYIKEYEEIHKLESEKEKQYEEQRIKNRQLQKDLRKIENDYSVLNKEHITIANELIENRLRMETLQDENKDLHLIIDDLKKQLEREIYKQKLPNPDAQIPTDLKEDLNKTMERNLEVMNENEELRERLDKLEKENYELKTGKTWTKDATSPRANRLGGWAFKTPWK